MRTVAEIIRESVDVKRAILEDPDLLLEVDRAAGLMIEAYRAGGKVLFCGNGGSAADAQHFAAELSGRYLFDRDPLPAEALHANTSYLTAVGNDYSYEEVFSRAVRASGRPGDVLVAISTSGSSANVVRAAVEASARGLSVIGLTGAAQGPIGDVATVCIRVPSLVTGRIQESHICLIHAISEIVEASLFEAPDVD